MDIGGYAGKPAIPAAGTARACRILEVDTSTYRYKSRRPDQAGLEARIKEICATRVRYGYRRVPSFCHNAVSCGCKTLDQNRQHDLGTRRVSAPSGRNINLSK